jgi:hypothetical protein
MRGRGPPLRFAYPRYGNRAPRDERQGGKGTAEAGRLRVRERLRAWVWAEGGEPSLPPFSKKTHKTLIFKQLTSKTTQTLFFLPQKHQNSSRRVLGYSFLTPFYPFFSFLSHFLPLVGVLAWVYFFLPP